MPQLTPEIIWNLKNHELLNLLDSGHIQSQLTKIHFYAPSFTYYKSKHFCSSSKDFPTVSITGTFCTLDCKHCSGKILETMYPALTPQELLNLCIKLKQAGAKGVLISGGCLPDGSVPLDNFLPVFGQIKRQLALTVFIHTGIINQKTAVALKSAGVDAVLLDVIGSTQTIRKVLNLKVTPESYIESLKSLNNAKLNFVPHIIVGLNEGKLDGELEALKMIYSVKPSALVIIAFMPIHGTAMAQTPPPNPLDIAKVTAAARLMFPKTPLVLGCMRPKGNLRRKTDVLALKAGVDAIAFPSEEAINYAQSKGWKINYSSYCCAQIYLDAADKTIK
jgi:lipoyl synthase